MPFYEYECSACRHQVEVLQKISDAPLRKCPHCGKSALKRLISAPVFRLKGSGWYETDFKTDQDRKRNLAGKDDGPAVASDDAKSEAAKPDAKADSKDKPAVAESKPAEKVADPSARSDTKKPAGKSAASPKPATKPARAKPVAKKKAVRR
jgi:putative FmdB family regulatory protein